MRRGLWAVCWGCVLRLWVMGYGLWVMGYGLRFVGYGLWIVGLGMGYGLTMDCGLGEMGHGLWVVGDGLWAMGCGYGHGHGWAVTCPKWHIDWRMKTLGHQICLRVYHYHSSICNGSLLARYATILHICCLLRWAMWYCTNVPFNYKVPLRNIRKP
jgi:hypothetical protein